MRAGDAQFVEQDFQVERIGGGRRGGNPFQPRRVELFAEAGEVMLNHPAAFVRRERLHAQRSSSRAVVTASSRRRPAAWKRSAAARR